MKYRDLVPGDVMRVGDEFLSKFFTVWALIPNSAFGSEFCSVIHVPHRRPIVEQWSFSTDEEHYQHQFDSLEETIGEIETWPDGTYWIGRCEDPRPAEELFSVDQWLEEVMEDEDYAGEWSEGFFEKLKGRKKDLEQHIKAAIGCWFDQNGMRPKFWNIDPLSVKKYVVEDGKASLS
jgi:hypothetical protein